MRGRQVDSDEARDRMAGRHLPRRLDSHVDGDAVRIVAIDDDSKMVVEHGKWRLTVDVDELHRPAALVLRCGEREWRAVEHARLL
jgi:hypothetical protein